MAQALGLAHLKALFLSLEAAPPPGPARRRARPVPTDFSQTRRERDESSDFFVYLLVSQHGCVFKLGHTRRLAERVRSLRGQHGGFVAMDSYLIRVRSKLLAFWIETELKRDFNQPEWRAKAPRPYPDRPYNDVGGKGEWYRLEVFTSMQATLLSLLQRDFDPEHPQYDPSAPFVPPAGMNLTEALCQAALPPSLSVPPPPSPEEVARRRAVEEAAMWREYSERNFRLVQSWVQVYWPWEVSLSPVTTGPDGGLRRTVCFSLLAKGWYPPEECTSPHVPEPPKDWHELCTAAHLRLRIREGGYVERRYFEPVLASESGGTLAVTFVLDALCEQEAACFDPPSDLPQRIRRWLVGLGGSKQDEAKVAAA